MHQRKNKGQAHLGIRKSGPGFLISFCGVLWELMDITFLLHGNKLYHGHLDGLRDSYPVSFLVELYSYLCRGATAVILITLNKGGEEEEWKWKWISNDDNEVKVDDKQASRLRGRILAVQMTNANDEEVKMQNQGG
ncbi:hypothetical protein BC835DRAFT_1307737 [Cytidiella melzeri]|nr:hypothetical protein BC835DRAFT_1307737 [Cytidiella melzeri]